MRFTARLSRRRVLALAPVTAAALAAACRRSGVPQRQAASTSPRLGGTVRCSASHDWDSLDLTIGGPGDAPFVEPICDGLLDLKTGPGIDSKGPVLLQPSLAERWEAPEPTQYVFHLRPGVKFADLPPVNGRELTAEDVKWSYEYESRTGPFAGRGLAKSQVSDDFSGLQAILAAPDRQTLTVSFSAPFAPFLNYAASHDLDVTPHEIFDQDGSFGKRLVGTGPWQLDPAASQRGTRWVYAKNANYWLTGQPYIERVEHVFLPDQATNTAAFIAGQLDVIGGGGTTVRVTKSMVQQITAKAPDAQVFKWSLGNGLLIMNVRKPPLSDLRVRQAISLAMNRDELARVATEGEGGWCVHGVPSGTFTPDEMRTMFPHDPGKAKQLLAQAGYADGLDLPLLLNPDYGNDYQRAAELLQAQLKDVGIRLSLQPLETGTFSNRIVKGDYVLADRDKLLRELDGILHNDFYPGSSGNYSGVNDPGLTSLLDMERRQLDPARRLDLLKQAARRVSVDQVWAIGLYESINFNVTTSRLKNYGPVPLNMYYGIRLNGSWLAK